MASNVYDILGRANPFGSYIQSIGQNVAAPIQGPQHPGGTNATNRNANVSKTPQVPLQAPTPSVTRTPRNNGVGSRTANTAQSRQSGAGSVGAAAASNIGSSNPVLPQGTAPGVRSQATGSFAGGGGAGVSNPIQPTGSPTSPSSSTATGAGGSVPNEGYGTGRAQTGFGQSFLPTSYESIWDDPAIMIQEWLNQSGAPTNTGSGAMTMNLADRIAINWMLMNNQGFADGTAGMDTADFIDWSDGYLENMRTPGGHVASTGDVLNMIMNPAENSPMYNNMYGANTTPDSQIRSAMNTMNYGLRGVTPSLMAQSMLSRVEQLGRQYQADIATGRDADGGYAHFGDYLAQNGIY